MSSIPDWRNVKETHFTEKYWKNYRCSYYEMLLYQLKKALVSKLWGYCNEKVFGGFFRYLKNQFVKLAYGQPATFLKYNHEYMLTNIL